MFTPVIEFATAWVAAHPAATLLLAYAVLGGGMGFVLSYFVVSSRPHYEAMCRAENRPPLDQKGMFWTAMFMGIAFWPVFLAALTFYYLWKIAQRLAYGGEVRVGRRAKFAGDGPGWVRAEFPPRGKR